MDQRLAALTDWLASLPDIGMKSITPASGDASFRRYFRVHCHERSYIAMDAPPDRENCIPYVGIAEAMRRIGLNVPQILHRDLAQGFLLLTDLGERQYLEVLDKDNAGTLYRDALRSLLTLQKAGIPEGLLPDYNRRLLLDEMSLFGDWFVGRHLSVVISAADRTLLARVSDWLADSALCQPRVWVHRDYHSRNLMWTETDNPGILDFQDAVCGPVTYDLVSLLRDCYIDWPQQQIHGWLRDYHQWLRQEHIISLDPQVFLRWFDLMGVQRHLKAIGIFARLNWRDHKPGYLKDIPRTMAYVLEVSRGYDELSPFYSWLCRDILPAMAEAGMAMDTLAVYFK